jgi:MFS family permease
MGATWRVLAGHRDLRLMLSAGLTSSTGDWILRVGLAYRVYALTGSTVASALTMMASFLPQMLLSPVAGVLADRWDRKRTMIAANLLLAAGLLPLLLVRSSGQLWIVLAVLAWEGTIAQFFFPAQQAMVPRLVPEDQLVTANALAGQIANASRLAGSALGGVIAAAGGIGAVTLADAASFVISAALIALIRADGRIRPGQAAPEPAASAHRGIACRPAGSGLAALRSELAGGLRLVAQHHVLRPLMVCILVVSVGEGIMSTLFAPFVRHVLDGSSQAYGTVAAAQAVGGIIGGIVAASVGHRVPAERMLGWGAVSLGLADLAIFLYPLAYVAVWPAAIGMVAAGIPGAVLLAGAMTLFQTSTEDSYRGRVYGALNAAEGAAILAGTVAAGFLAQLAGIIPVLSVQGAGYVVAGLMMLAVLRSTRRRRADGALRIRPAPATPGRDTAG